MSRAALDESLARLDAALGTTPVRHGLQTPLRTKGHLVTPGNISSIFDGNAVDVSITNRDSPFANMSGIGDSVLGNDSIFGDEVTAPVSVSVANQTLDLTTTAIPAHHNAQVLFSEFVRIMVGGGGTEGVWGEIQEYEAACHQQAEHIDALFRKMPCQKNVLARTRQALHQLVFERNVWRLLRSLYADRQCRSDELDDDEGQDWLKSDQTVVTELYDSSREIREAQLVVDWLEKCASDTLQQQPEQLQHYSDSHVAWENTLREAKASARGRGKTRSNLIKSLDPDAPVRTGAALHELDELSQLLECLFGGNAYKLSLLDMEGDERVLARRVLQCLRSGALHEAQQHCAAVGQHWRAAVLEGWKLHHDPNVGAATKGREPVQGNPCRDVWKVLAWRASDDARLSDHERALLGALCGNLPAMLLVCRDWEDLLWAHTKVLLDQRVEERIRTARANTPARRSLVPLPQQYPEQRLTMSSVFARVEQCNDNEILNPYYIICKYLILDDMDGLVDAVQRWLRDGPAPHLLRCLTHLLLLLRRLDRMVEPEHQEVADQVLHACVKAAMERGDVEQVARYTAALPPAQQVPCYCAFLMHVTDAPQRRHALHLARMVGLDARAVATTTAAIIRLQPMSLDVEGGVGDTSQCERVRISGLDWLLGDEELRAEALVQTLALVRTLLIARKVSAASMAMDKLPSDTLSVVGSDDVTPEVEAALREYLCIKAFLSAQEFFSDWFDHFHQQKPCTPVPPPATATYQQRVAFEHATLHHEAAMARWQATLDRLSTTACERLYNVLLFPDGGWLVDPTLLPHNTSEPDSGVSARLQHLSPELAAREPDRLHQLATLRSIYIPQVSLLLQSILSSTGQQQRCLQLADVIASEKHQLYAAFGSAELQRFLRKMLDSSQYLLDHDKDSLGYPLH